MSLALTLGAALWGCSKAPEVNENAVLPWESGVFVQTNEPPFTQGRLWLGAVLQRPDDDAA